MLNVVDRFGVALLPKKGKRAYFGVSICSRFFSKSNIISMSKWCSESFDQFLILIADDPQAFTFMATKQIDFDSALLKARQIGHERFNSISQWLQSSRISNASLLSWRDIASNRQFLRTLNYVNICFTENTLFREDVFSQIQSRNSALPDDMEFARIRKHYFNTAAQYVINEIAVMSFLQEFSRSPWPIQIFPLPMPPVLKGLYEKKYCTDVALNPSRSGYIRIEIEHGVRSGNNTLAQQGT